MNRTDKDEIIKVVNSELKKFVADSLDKEVKRIVGSSNSQVRKELVKLIGNSMESVYKLLWQKRDFWKHDIK